jgi:hypothetical protein
MKKYSRKTRKSYFPKLFFQQDFKSSDPRKIHVFSHIKIDFHNTLFWKNFPLSFPKEKQNEDFVFPSKVKFLYLNSYIYTHEKNMSSNHKPGEHEPQNLTPRLISHGLTSQSSTFPEPINSEFIYLNYPSANSTSPNFKFLKVKSFGNNSRIFISKIINGTQILQNQENFFLKEDSLFFKHSRIDAIHRIIYQKVGHIADYPAYPPIFIPATSGLFREIHNKTLRKIENLRFSGRNNLSSENITTVTLSKGFRTSDGSLELLNRFFKSDHLKQKSWARKMKSESSQMRRFSASKQSKKVIWEKQNLIVKKEKQNISGLIDSRSWELVTKDQKRKDSSKIWTDRADMHVLLDSFNNSRIQSGSKVIQNTNFMPSIKFPTKNFLEKNAFFPYLEYSSGSKSSRISRNIIHEQKKGRSQLSEKKSRQPLSLDATFSAQNAIAGIKISGKFIKNLFIWRNEFSKEDELSLPCLSIRPTFRPITLIRGLLLISKNEILSFGAFTHGSSSVSKDHKSKNDHKSNRYMGYNRSERVSLEYFSNNSQQYPKIINETRSRIYEKILPSIFEKQTKNLQSILKLKSLLNLELKSSGHVLTRDFNWLTTLTRNIAVVSQINWQVPSTPSSTATSQLNKKEKRTLVGEATFQINHHGINKSEFEFFTPDFHVRIKPASKALISASSNLRFLLAKNKLAHIIGTYTIDSPESIVQGKNHYLLDDRLQKIFELSKVLLPFSTVAIKDENPAHFQNTPVIQEYNNTAAYIPEKLAVQVFSFIINRIFNNLMAFKSNFTGKHTFNCITAYATGIKKTYSYFQQASRVFNYAETRTFSDMPGYAAGRECISKINSTTYYTTANYHISRSHVADHYTTNKEEVENKKISKKERQYFAPINKLGTIVNQHAFSKSSVFTKYLETIIFRPKWTKDLLYSGKQCFASNKTVTPILSQHEDHVFSSHQNHTVHITAYTGTDPATGEFNYLPIRTQSCLGILELYHENIYPFNFITSRISNLKKDTINYIAKNNYIQRKARNISTILKNNHLEKRIHLEKRTELTLSNLSLFFPKTGTSISLLKKDILEHFKTFFSPSGVDIPAATEYSEILSKVQNPIMGDRLLLNSLFSDRSLDASVSLISGTLGPSSRKKTILRYGLSKYTDLIIPQNLFFDRKSGVHSSTITGSLSEGSLGHQTASISQSNERQKPNRQKVPYLKRARMNLNLRGGKRENENTDLFLQTSSANNLSRGNSNQQVYKNMITPVESSTGRLISSYTGSVFSSRPDFTLGMMWKKVFSTISQEKKPEDRMGISKKLFLGFESTQVFEKIIESHMYPGPRSADYVFPRAGRAGKTPRIAAFGTSGEERSELRHAGGKNHKRVREELVYGTQQILLGEVKKIENVVFKTKEVVADHLEYHLQQEAVKAGQAMDIEQMSEKIMQMINRRLKIEVERRGIF